ncbi:uncharacterized protein LOC124505623 isoform X1 [Lynx rufus]|uniref:uncharacterized protein LOC124505623 isoform X1 n=1 Tax=Lynx rufus TaxID=61384 RepID=UPI001F124E84|nr:uncharacterized protein LOC124505623 isoform X1 [Lynx rufus]
MAQFHGEPKPGDLIEILHIGYEHWAIYVGDGYVIHLTPPSDLLGASFSIICSVLSSKAVVRQELLRDVVGHCRYRVNNHLDHKYKPRPVKVIICSAKKKIGEEMEYRLLGKNCEHFVTDLRYGVPHSRQVVRKSLGQPSTVTRLRKRAHRQGVCSRSTGLRNGSSICLCGTYPDWRRGVPGTRHSRHGWLLACEDMIPKAMTARRSPKSFSCRDQWRHPMAPLSTGPSTSSNLSFCLSLSHSLSHWLKDGLIVPRPMNEINISSRRTSTIFLQTSEPGRKEGTLL